jgi:hypothetical protein
MAPIRDRALPPHFGEVSHPDSSSRNSASEICFCSYFTDFLCYDIVYIQPLFPVPVTLLVKSLASPK